MRVALSLTLAVVLTTSLAAQDSTKGVRIGLRYDPSTKPGIAVLPVSGPQGDSIRTILERDFDFSDRLAVITLTSADGALLSGGAPAGTAASLNYPVFAKLGAAAVVQVTSTPDGGLHVALHDVGAARVARIDDYTLPKPELSRDWRFAVHGIADGIEEAITTQRGIAQTRIAFIRSNIVRIIDSDGEMEVTVPVVGPALSPSWNPAGTVIAYNTFGADTI
jgi:TolB protein